MTVTLAAEHGIKGLYEMYRGAMEGHINASRREPWNDALERKQFFEQLSVVSVRIIRVDGNVAGFVDFRPGAERCGLQTMIVAPQYQSQGVGAAVLAGLKTEALKRPMGISVLKTNPRALYFYERQGFNVSSSSQDHDQMVWTPAES